MFERFLQGYAMPAHGIACHNHYGSTSSRMALNQDGGSLHCKLG